MTITSLEQYKEQSKGKAYLGRMVLFCQFDAVVPYIDLKDALEAAGLGDHCPRKPSLIDVFRRVSTSAQRKRIDVGDGKYANVLVRDVANDEQQLLRKLVTETVDASGKRLDYRPDFDLVFDRASETFTAVPLTNGLYYSTDAAEQVVTEIAANFARLRDTVDSGTVRAVVSRVLKANHSISARPTGGADFILEKHAGVVDALETLPAKIAGCWIHSIPLIDDDKQRGYVKAQVEDDTTGEIDSALTEMRKLLNAGESITSAKFASINTTFKQLQSRADAYRELLGDKLEGTKARLDIYNATMAQLARQVKVAA